MEINWNAERNYTYLDEADKVRQQTQNVRRKKQQQQSKLPKHRRKVIIIQIRSKINKIKIQRNNRNNQTI